MSVGNPIRFHFVFALSIVLLIMLVLSTNKLSGLRLENGRLHDRTADLDKQLTAAVADRDTLRKEAGDFAARLADATNSSSASLSAAQGAQNALHDKLRAEIARLSADNVLKDTQMDVVRVQNQEIRELQNKTESSFQKTQNALTAMSNQVNQLRAQDADKAARLTQKDQELAAKATELAAKAAELAAKTTELAAAKNAAAQAAAAQAAAEQNAKAAQAQITAVQAELAALKTRIAELEAEKAKAVVSPAVSK
jgi:chromosome segregation ATPase